MSNHATTESAICLQPGAGQQEETRAFLSTLFPLLPLGSKLLIWTLPEKRSFWCETVEEAVATVERVRVTSDVYFGIGLAGKDFGATRRCPASEVIAIPGMWADFDIAGAGHKKANLPPNREAILELMREAGLPPTVSINSGHGLQCYWLLEDLWEFASDTERANAEGIVRRWNYTLRELARKRGWDVDSTWDLARVYRVPGTTNRKVKHEPAPVHIIQQDGPRYTLAQIEPKLAAEDPAASLRNQKAKGYGSVQVAEDITLDPAASVDIELFELLKEADPKFEASWERKRKDFQDQSGSSYDMSLATIAAQAGWDDQQIVNLLIAHRRKHGDDLKLRPDYYRRTLCKARQPLIKREAVEQLEQMLHSEAPQDDPQERQQDERRRATLQHVSALLGFEIRGIVKYTGSEPTYRLETPRGTADLGNVTGLIKQEALRNKVAALTGYLIPKFKPNLWDTIAQSLLNAVEERDLGEEATEEGTTREWLRTYFRERLHNAPFQEEGAPFLLEGKPHFASMDLVAWLRTRLDIRVTREALAVKLGKINCTKRADVRLKRPDGTETKKNLWSPPEGFEW
jgi:hypothetical protein